SPCFNQAGGLPRPYSISPSPARRRLARVLLDGHARFKTEGRFAMTPRSILAITDLSLQGGHALTRAALLCAEHGATLKLVYLAPSPEDSPPDAALRLARHAVQLRLR